MIATRVDDNQAQITKDLRKIGCAVTPIHTVGKGVSDLLVSYEKKWFVFELKDGSKVKSAQNLTNDEIKWIEAQKATVFIVRNTAECLKVLHQFTFGDKREGENCQCAKT